MKIFINNDKINLLLGRIFGISINYFTFVPLFHKGSTILYLQLIKLYKTYGINW